MSLPKLLLTFLISILLHINMNAQEIMFYTGTTSADAEKSINVGILDEEKGEIHFINACNGGQSPGYLALSKSREYLYAVSSAFADIEESVNIINAFKIDKSGQNIEKIDSRSCFGSNPCYISLNPENSLVMWANYSSGDFGLSKLKNDGSFGDSVAFIRHSGSGPNKKRQEMAHAHYIRTSPDGKFIFVCDLGIDKVMIYTFNEIGDLISNPNQPFLELSPGSGPRHLAFHPSGNLVFILNELSSSVVACQYDPEMGKLQKIDEQSTLIDDSFSPTKAAAVRVHPNGKFLYCSNRGENNIAVFSVRKNGKLKKIQNFQDGIGVVRDFNISPSGKFIIAGNQYKNEIVLLKVSEKGILSATGQGLSAKMPTCIAFY
jgi:6-phosphogluconolactonase